MQRIKPALAGVSNADLKEGVHNAHDDPQQLDDVEGYSQPNPGEETKQGGFVERNNYHDRH